LFTASTAAEIVRLLKANAPFGESPEPTDADFMREAADRARMLHEAGLGGGIIHYDTPWHFFWDV
jgi:hypothetical protein